MPRQPQTSIRCVYSENGRQCRRNGKGDPSLCQAHRIAWQQAANRPSSRGEAVIDFLFSKLSGERTSRRQREAAAADLHGMFTDFVQAAQQQQVPPPTGQQPPPRQAPPRRPDPMVEARRRFQAAKAVMEFGPDENITADMVNQRRKDLARKYHPDRQGGSLEKMTRINAAADELLRSAA